jgi:hypothetical protein
MKRRYVRRAIDAEARWGLPFNEFLVRFYEWLFVVLGPVAAVLGLVFIASGFWIGLVSLGVGLWMAALGFRRAWRVLSRRREP